MRKVNLKFIGLGYNNYYQACIKIYDKCNNLIFEDKTYNGIVSVELEENEVYRLIADSCRNRLNIVFFVNECRDCYCFNFQNNRIITFLLRDFYYNLPIEKGEIYLWQQ